MTVINNADSTNLYEVTVEDVKKTFAGHKDLLEIAKTFDPELFRQLYALIDNKTERTAGQVLSTTAFLFGVMLGQNSEDEDVCLAAQIFGHFAHQVGHVVCEPPKAN